MASFKSQSLTTLPQMQANPVMDRRNRTIANLEEQKRLLQGPGYTRTVKVWTNKDGERQQAEKKQRVLPWWRVFPNGSVVLTVRVAQKPIEFEKGKAGIAVPSVEKLPSVIDTLITAIRNGELDEQLAQASKVFPTKKKNAGRAVAGRRPMVGLGHLLAPQRRKDLAKVLVNHIETLVAQHLGMQSQICVYGEFCGKGLAVEHDGSLYAFGVRCVRSIRRIVQRFRNAQTQTRPGHRAWVVSPVCWRCGLTFPSVAPVRQKGRPANCPLGQPSRLVIRAMSGVH